MTMRYRLDSLTEFVRTCVENNKQKKRLRVFDFDDTLVKTDCKIRVVKRDGVVADLTPGQFATYDPSSTDEFDFSDFEKLIKPKQIKQIVKILQNVVNKHGADSAIVLTSRGSPTPVIEFLNDIDMPFIDVVALNSIDPNDKAWYIEQLLKKGDIELIEFFDDSVRNVDAVKKLKEKYPDVQIIARVVQYE